MDISYGNRVSRQTRLLLNLYFCTIVTICSLYAAQPIQPVFQQELGLSSYQAILFTTLVLLPLGVAPLFYGYLLEVLPVRQVARTSLLLLGILQFFFSLTDDYLLLLAIRAGQGLLIPAVLTSLMSYISLTSAKETVQHAIALYVGATVIGGFLGRFLSGLLTDIFGWRIFFFVLSLFFLLAWKSLDQLEETAGCSFARSSFGQVLLLLGSRRLRWLYGAIFCISFAFVALLNFLPFEIKILKPDFGESGIGLLYFGYSTGLLVALYHRRVLQWCGGELQAVRNGLLIFCAGTILFLLDSYLMMFVGMFIVCLGMFTAHTMLSGYVSRLTEKHQPIANGLYLSSYYLGGTLGSFAPGYFFERYGWAIFVTCLILVQLIAMICITFLRKALASG